MTLAVADSISGFGHELAVSAKLSLAQGPLVIRLAHEVPGLLISIMKGAELKLNEHILMLFTC